MYLIILYVVTSQYFATNTCKIVQNYNYQKSRYFRDIDINVTYRPSIIFYDF
jgi:hypothetical protein